MFKYLKNKFNKQKSAPVKPSHPKASHASPINHNKAPMAKSESNPARENNANKTEKPQLNNKIKHIIAIASGKGRVGKSTVCANLAFALSKQGHKVGVLDADIYGPSQSTLLGNVEKAKGEDGALLPLESNNIKFISMSSVNPKDGAIIVRAPVATRAVNQFLTDVRWGELDFLLVDLPPGTGDIPLSLAQKASLSGAIIVTTPQSMATQIAVKSLQMFQKVNVPILGVIENMSSYVCQHCGDLNHLFKDGGGSKISKECEVPLLAQLPLDPSILAYSEQGTSMIDEMPEHVLSQALIKAANSITQHLLPEKMS